MDQHTARYIHRRALRGKADSIYQGQETDVIVFYLGKAFDKDDHHNLDLK